jgi:hypothetical protein
VESSTCSARALAVLEVVPDSRKVIMDAMASDDGTDRDRVEELRRWADAGAVWQVVTRGPTSVVVALCRCDGGEEVERFTSSNPDLLAFLAGRLSSEE